ncbi:MAG: hypothetical protein IAB80_05190, partial [Bacteroidetes bacterium]|nr:hypothetical protein [Candidatus Cryptobacteroides excrementipullorum]
MQNSRQRHFFKRCVEYAAKVYDSGSRRGGGYSDIPPVYFIGIVSADMGVRPERGDVARQVYLELRIHGKGEP